MLDDKLLLNLLNHIEQNWSVVAITSDEVLELRVAGYVEAGSLRLTNAGRLKLAALRTQ